VLRHGEGTALRREAATLAADLGALTGHAVPVRAARGTHARPGDVLLTLTARDAALGDEGYSLRVGRALSVAAHTAAGVFDGGRTVLQLVRLGEAVPRGHARDWPRYPQRGLMVDDGRAFYPLDWLERRVRALADLKLNVFHLHISDDQGFRIQSDTHPEAVTKPFLSKADVRALVGYAARYHVTIVPEIDMPGHMTALLAKHPELQLADALGQRQPDKLDVTLPAARAFVGQLLDEYLPLFPGAYWHSGSDEYLGVASTPADYDRYPQLAAFAQAKYGASANGQDAVIDFANFVGERIRAAGKQQRVWSDGMTGGSAVELDHRAVVEWWENLHSLAPADLVARGYRVFNVGWWPLYYVTGGPLVGLRSTPSDFFAEFEPWRFEGPYTPRWLGGPPAAQTVSPQSPGVLGAGLAVWNDDPSAPGAQPDAVAAGIAPRLRLLAQKTWGTKPDATDYASFERSAAAASGPLTP